MTTCTGAWMRMSSTGASMYKPSAFTFFTRQRMVRVPNCTVAEISVGIRGLNRCSITTTPYFKRIAHLQQKVGQRQRCPTMFRRYLTQFDSIDTAPLLHARAAAGAGRAGVQTARRAGAGASGGIAAASRAGPGRGVAILTAGAAGVAVLLLVGGGAVGAGAIGRSA